ncbi:hypothetical protein [Clostridium arbusti]|uniref:hypothetical protein n=1 Tax=Clostridium arbusti TaxID=1137848 RepID=UPI000288F377|nr:hypothetical protein [Clostridium arbusti]
MKNIKENNINFDDIKDAGIDNIEVALDNFLQDRILKEIPFVKTVIALFKTGKSIRDYLLMEKLCAFLTNIEDIPQDKINKFINKLENEKNITKIGIKILQIIDRLDDTRKAELIGKLFKVLLDEEINSSQYFRLCYIIDKCYYDDIFQLKYIDEDGSITSHNKQIDNEILENLFSNGLLSSKGIDEGTFENTYGGTIYVLNDYSKILIRLI